jgi:hypothetical protein
VPRFYHDKWSRNYLSLFFYSILKQHVNIVFQHALISNIKRKIALTSEVMLVLDLPLLLDLTICMQATSEGPRVRLPRTKRGTSSLPLSWFLRIVSLLAFIWPSLLVSSLMVPAINLLLDFCILVLFTLQISLIYVWILTTL